MKAASEAALIKLSRKLTPQKRRELLKYGETLYAQEEKKPMAVEEGGDAAWERIIADPKSRPKLRAEVEKIRAEMKAGKHFPPMRAEDL